MPEEELSPLWRSCRLTYTICAFVNLVLQLCMRNSLNFAILCMVQQGSEKAVEGVSEPEFHWSRSQELTLQSSFYYGYLLTQPFGGWLCDKFGGKPVFIFGLTSQSVAFLLIPICARMHFWISVVARMCQGLCAGAGAPAVYQLYTVWAHPTERTTLVSIGYAGFTIGSLISFPITSLLCQRGWVNVFYIIGGVAILFGTMCYWLVYSSIDTHPRISESEFEYLSGSRRANFKMPPIPWKQMITSCSVLTFIDTHFCHTYGVLMVTMILPKYYSEVLKFDMNSNGFYSAVLFLGGIISRLVVIFTFPRIYAKLKLTKTVFQKIVYVAGSFFVVLFIITVTSLTFENRIYIVVLFCFIGMMADVSFVGGYWTNCLDIAPAFAGLLNGVANALATSSGVFAPMIVEGLVYEGSKEEWNNVFYTVAGTYTFSMVVYAIFGSSNPEPWGQFLPSEVEDTN